MATWVRNQLTANTPNATDNDVVGTVELDNATAPGDFDPDGVNSVRIQTTMAVVSGTIVDDAWTITHEHELTLDGDGTAIASVNSTNQTLDVGTQTRSSDATDSSIATGLTAAQWEGAELNEGPATTIWAQFSQVMKADGVNVGVTAVTVTIDYTPVSGQTIAVGVLAETDSPVAIGGIKTVTVGTIAEVNRLVGRRYGLLELDGVNSSVAAADQALLDVTGDLEIIAVATLDESIPVADSRALAGHMTASTGGWLFAVGSSPNGRLRFSYDEGAGRIDRQSTATAPIVEGVPLWYRVVFDVDNGASGHDVLFYTSTDPVDTPVNEVSWSQLGTTVTTAGVAAPLGATDRARVGAFNTSWDWVGDIHGVWVYDDLGQVPHVDLDGTADYLSCGDDAAFDITGDIDVRVGAHFEVVGAANEMLMGRWDGGTTAEQHFTFVREGASSIWLYWRTAAQLLRSQQSDTGLAVTTPRHYRVTLDVVNGTDRVITFYYSDEPMDTPRASISWTQHSQHVVSGTTDIQGGGTNGVTLGERFDTPGEDLLGKIYWAELRDGIGGTVVLDPDYRFGDITTDDQGNTWTKNAQAVFHNPLVADPDFREKTHKDFYYFDGTGDKIGTGDKAALDITGDIEIITLIHPDVIVGNQGLLEKKGANTGYRIALLSTGAIQFYWGDGAAEHFKPSVADDALELEHTWIRATLDVDDGASGHIWTIYTSTDPIETKVGDVSWSVAATTTEVGTTSIATNTQSVELAIRDGIADYQGRIYGAWVYDGLVVNGGTLVADADFREPQTDHVYFDGTGDYVETVDKAQLDIVGDLELITIAALDDWESGVEETFVAKWNNTGSQRSYRMSKWTDDSLRLKWSTDGIDAPGEISDVPIWSTGVNNGEAIWLRATVVTDNGASVYEVKFWFSRQPIDTPIREVRWTQLGSTELGGATTSIFSGSSTMRLGMETSGGAPATGKVYAAWVYDYADGTTPTIEASTKNQTTVSNSVNHTVEIPDGSHIAGKLLIAAVGMDNDTLIPNKPDGWTELGNSEHAGVTCVAWYRVVDGSEGFTGTGDTVAFITNSSETGFAVCARLRDFDPALIADATGATTGSDANPNPPNHADAGAKAYLWLAVAAMDAEEAITGMPTSYTVVENGVSTNGAGASCAMASRVLTAVEDDPATFAAGSSAAWAALTIAVHPLPVYVADPDYRTEDIAADNVGNTWTKTGSTWGDWASIATVNRWLPNAEAAWGYWPDETAGNTWSWEGNALWVEGATFAKKKVKVGTLAETDALVTVAVVQGGGQTIAVGTLAETDGLVAIAAEKPIITAVGVLAETDGLVAIAGIKTVAVGTLAETNPLVGISGIKTATIGTLAETDSLIPIAVIHPQVLAVGTLAELDGLVAIGGIKTVTVGTLAGSDLLVAIAAIKPIVTTVGTLSELESLIAIEALKIAPVGTLTETETLLPIEALKIAPVGTLAETDSLVPVEALKPIITDVGTLAQTDGLLPIVLLKPIVLAVGTLAEAESLIPISGIKTVTVGTLGETDSLVAIAALKPIITAVGTLGETDALIAIQVLQASVAVGTLAETDSLVAIQAFKTVTVGTLAGTDALVEISAVHVAVIGTLGEVEVLVAVQALKIAPVGTLAELETLLPIAAEKPILTAVGVLAELETLLPVSPIKVAPVGTIGELELLIAIAAVKPVVTAVGTLSEIDALITILLVTVGGFFWQKETVPFTKDPAGFTKTPVSFTKRKPGDP
jgi:hypothetical protein